MKIANIKCYPLGVHLDEPLWWGTLRCDVKGGTVVEIVTDEGLHGFGEAGFSADFFPLVKSLLERDVAPLIVGEDPTQISRIWQKIFEATHLWGRRGVQTYALSGVDIALWDLMGKIAGLPVYKLLGGVKPKVRAYFAPSLKSPDVLIEETLAAAAKGFGAVKVRITDDEHSAVDLVKRLRAELGDGFNIAVDANMAFDRKGALRIAKAYEELGVAWLEEPIRAFCYADYLREHEWLSQRVGLKISGGEPLLTHYEYVEAFERHVFDIIQPDAAAVGGITECKRVADMADASRIACIPHVACSSGIGIGMSANLHTILASPNAPMLEFDAYGGAAWDGLLQEPLEVVDGFVEAIDKPGLGVDFVHGQAERFLLSMP